jgi:hypothetical protein
VGVLSCTDVDTVNDPHETGIFKRIFEELGSTPGQPALAFPRRLSQAYQGRRKRVANYWCIANDADHKEPGHRNLDDLDDSSSASRIGFSCTKPEVPPQRSRQRS